MSRMFSETRKACYKKKNISCIIHPEKKKFLVHGSVKKIVPVLKNPDTPERSNCPPLDKKFFKRPAKKGSKYTARKKGRSTPIPTFDRLFDRLCVCMFFLNFTFVYLLPRLQSSAR